MMAIVGNVLNVKKYLQKTESINIIFNYFNAVIDRNSCIHRRITNLPDGDIYKHNISHDIFALEQSIYTKNREDCFIESHKKYIDFQLVLFGNEQLEYIDINKLEVEKAYNEEVDLITYKLVNDTSKILLQANDLAIFFPEDGHLALSKFEKPQLIFKVVVKIPVSLYK
ncbi:conserved hypothetical protein (DUF386 domain) [Aliarcobacter butzleri 7h1h]|uniref:YhcH/YjgK/YiaL family protein n=1 Tax=Aliarcobacter butzleri TaxID=28197 RepID=UPI00035B99CB|nr:YhcH/YjgK/YiaL family protein [Aliarcobacter butzleri]AGR76972.1 conserved hypothetical protein (DUF386 domain) [Aliarcobacter butzleri 7h1h]